MNETALLASVECCSTPGYTVCTVTQVCLCYKRLDMMQLLYGHCTAAWPLSTDLHDCWLTVQYNTIMILYLVYLVLQTNIHVGGDSMGRLHL